MIVFAIIAMVVLLGAVCLQLKRDLMMLQQNSYRYERFRHWMSENGESTAVNRLVAIILFMALATFMIPRTVMLSVMTAFGLWMVFRLAVKKYKKPLVFTARATRIYVVALVLVALFTAVLMALRYNDPGWPIRLYMGCFMLLICYAYSYWVILLANLLLMPVESAITRKYYREAQGILQSMGDMKVIGITGSYGKTSTKHYLYRILCEEYDVLMTPGNFNTTLGVVRTVREHLKPFNQVFIVEMGAKQPGDIAEICELVHPTIGIVTAVGPQHLESFGTIENVQSTKFELTDALPADGLAVVNNDFEFIANRPVDNTECVRYAVEHTEGAQFVAKDIKYSPKGTTFTIAGPDGLELTLFTRLVGRCNVSNLMAAVIVALHLGVSADKIRYAVEQIEQVEHRLSIKRAAGGMTIIDDAYNSNPVGSQMALEVLSGITGGKRIVITPGMIELGDDQYELNRQLGQTIATSADIAIVVGEYNRDAILEGIAEGGMDEKAVHTVDTFNQAQKLLMRIAAAGDTVLYENDLPDTFK